MNIYPCLREGPAQLPCTLRSCAGASAPGAINVSACQSGACQSANRSSFVMTRRCSVAPRRSGRCRRPFAIVSRRRASRRWKCSSRSRPTGRTTRRSQSGRTIYRHRRRSRVMYRYTNAACAWRGRRMSCSLRARTSVYVAHARGGSRRVLATHASAQCVARPSNKSSKLRKCRCLPPPRRRQITRWPSRDVLHAHFAMPTVFFVRSDAARHMSEGFAIRRACARSSVRASSPGNSRAPAYT